MQSTTTAYLKCQTTFHDDFMNCLIFNGSLTVCLCVIKTLAFRKKMRKEKREEELMNEWMEENLPFFILPLSRLEGRR